MFLAQALDIQAYVVLHVERLLAAPGLGGKFEGTHEPYAPDLADQRMVRERAEALLQCWRNLTHMPNHVHLLIDF